MANIYNKYRQNNSDADKYVVQMWLQLPSDTDKRIRLSSEMLEAVESQAINSSLFIREAIAEKLARNGIRRKFTDNEVRTMEEEMREFV